MYFIFIFSFISQYLDRILALSLNTKIASKCVLYNIKEIDIKIVDKNSYACINDKISKSHKISKRHKVCQNKKLKQHIWFKT